jgi:hypothetical protein
MDLKALVGADYGWVRSPRRTPRRTESRREGEPPFVAGGWTPGRRTQCDPLFHPGRRLCYSIGGTGCAEAERSKEILAELFERRHDTFQLRLESCTHDRPAVSLRGEPSGDFATYEHKTQYDRYAESLAHMIDRFNTRPRFKSDSFSTFISMQGCRASNSGPRAADSQWRRIVARVVTWSRARAIFGIFPHPWATLRFVWNQKPCLPPTGAKAARRDSSLPRIGAFEVVMAVYRRSENHWYEFVLWSKLDALRFPCIDRLEDCLEACLGYAMARLRPVILLQACLRRKLMGDRRFAAIRIKVACMKIQGCFRTLLVRNRLLLQKLQAVLRRAVDRQRRKPRVDFVQRLDLRRRVGCFSPGARVAVSGILTETDR